MRTSDVAVVVSTFNRPQALDLVLAGLARQSVLPLQILIADDGSRSETADVVIHWASRGLPIEHCWHADKGFRKTIILNQAASKICAPYVIFLDGDCIPLKSFVSDHLKLSGPKTILAGSRVLASQSYTRALESGAESCFDRGLGYWLIKGVTGATNRFLPTIRLPDGAWRDLRPENWRLVRGCNFSLFTEDFLLADGFDETIVGWGREDSDLAVRLIHLGLRVKSLACAAPVVHLWHQEESRNRLTLNDRHLAQTLAEGRTKARTGLSSRINPDD